MKLKSITQGLLLLSCAGLAHAQDHTHTLSIELTNLTQGIAFTPLLVSAHGAGTDLFEVGEPASSSLQAMAEGGALDGLVADLQATGAALSTNPAGGPLMPTMSAMVEDFDPKTNTHLSITAMLLPTNDGFVGLDAWPIPSEPGTYTLMLNGYDAGTEANDERVIDGGGMPGALGIPAVPFVAAGEGGTGVTTTIPNDSVHIHPGNIGDSDMTGGISDLMSHQHRWLNPVAKVVITVQ